MIDLTRPDLGLVDLAMAGDGLADAGVLGVGLVEPAAFRPQLPAECYVRGTDLVAVYDESPARPVRIDALWRATATQSPPGVIAVVDLLVSVRTSLLESQPALAVGSTVPADQVLRLGGPDLAEHAPAVCLNVPAGSPLVLRPAEGPGCLVFRPGHGDRSYAEMVHPADFHEAVLCRTGPQGELLRVAYPLFPQPLEKGVILRARVRGAWLALRDDVRLAAGQYEALVADAPPLGA